MQSWIVSIVTPVLSVTWSFRNHANMLICCSRNISYYYQCWQWKMFWLINLKPLSWLKVLISFKTLLHGTLFLHTLAAYNMSLSLNLSLSITHLYLFFYLFFLTHKQKPSIKCCRRNFGNYKSTSGFVSEPLIISANDILYVPLRLRLPLHFSV